VAPRRGNTLQQFVDIASNLFSDEGVQVSENYDELITDLHLQVSNQLVLSSSICRFYVNVCSWLDALWYLFRQVALCT
jgi:hypothetical protein